MTTPIQFSLKEALPNETTRTRTFNDSRCGWWHDRRGHEQFTEKAAQQQQAAAQQQATQQQMTDLQAQQAQLTAQQEALAQQQATAQMAPAGPAAGSLDDQLVQIQKLSVMKDQGLLTDEEFAAKKKRILGL